MAINKKKGTKAPKSLTHPKKAPKGPSKAALRQWVSTQHDINAARKDPETPNMGAAFHAHGLNRPGRKERAAAMLPKTPKGVSQGTEANTFERYKAVKQWLSERPGGGSPSGATHQQWVAWGSRNPNIGSLRSHALSGKQWSADKQDYGTYNRFKHGENRRED